MTGKNQENAPGPLGKKVATVGAAMIAGSIVLGLVGVGGETMHNILVLGGVGLGVIGIVLWRIVKV